MVETATKEEHPKQSQDTSTSASELPIEENSAPAGSQTQEPKSLHGILQKLVKVSEETEGSQTSVQEIVKAFGNRAHGPLLLIPAFVALFPLTGGIPGMSILTGMIMILIGFGMLFRHGSVWLPHVISQRAVSHEKLKRVVEKNEKWIRWFDKGFQARLEFLTKKPFSYLIAVMCIALAATMFPLAFVPMGAAVPSFVILLLALALTAHDGIVALIAFVLSGVSVWLTYYLITTFWDNIQSWLSWMGLV